MTTSNIINKLTACGSSFAHIPAGEYNVGGNEVRKVNDFTSMQVRLKII